MSFDSRKSGGPGESTSSLCFKHKISSLGTNPSTFHHLNLKRHPDVCNTPEAQQVHVLQLFRVYQPPPAEKEAFQRASLCATCPRRRATAPPSGQGLYSAMSLLASGSIYEVILGSLIFDVCQVSVTDLAVTLILVKSLYLYQTNIILHHSQLSQEGRLVHEVPLVPVMNINKIISGRLRKKKHSFRSSLDGLVYLQLHQALQPHQGRLGNPVAPTGAKCCKELMEYSYILCHSLEPFNHEL